MAASISSFSWLLLLFLLCRSTYASLRLKLPRLSPIGGTFHHEINTFSSSNVSDDLQTFYYNQTLDHFNYRPESYSTFQQRYLINFKYWGGAKANAPILAYLGAEAPIDGDLVAIGFLSDNAVQFNALLVFIEHRYYGKSIPFGSREEALSNASTLGYFNSAQAIADYAAILMHLKDKLQAKYSPVIVVGGSYGGMLASWFRLKYPHVALGALASSAPILYFDDIVPQNGYFTIVTKDFREASESCYETILKSWSEMENISLSLLSKQFNTCSPLTSYIELENNLWLMYSSAAQYDSPPRYPVDVICRAIDGASPETDIAGKIAAGVFAYKRSRPCYINEPQNVTKTAGGWTWQRCSEIVMPIGSDNTTMFPVSPFNLQTFVDSCYSVYGVPPRPHWITSYYGGHDIKLILKRFGSNIIFSNGLRDPYSIGGVLEDISDSIVAVHTPKGSHCLDILRSNETDPKWLKKQRKTEVKIIKGWIEKYYIDLGNFTKY